MDGTTDTTRTIHFGTPTEEERHNYTLVLKGHISLDMAIFPKGTTGYGLDILARKFLTVSLRLAKLVSNDDLYANAPTTERRQEL